MEKEPGFYEGIIADQTRIIEETRPDETIADRTDALLTRAEAYHALGQLPLAIADLEAAVEAAKMSANPRRLAVAYGSFGSARTSDGDFQRAKEALDHSLEIAKQEGLVDVEATTLINLANLHAASNNAVEARRTYHLAAEQARAAGMTGTEVHAVLNAGRVAVNAGHSLDARDDARRAEALIGEIPDGPERLNALLALGVLLQDLYVADEPASDDNVKLQTTFGKAADLAEGLGDRRARSLALGNLAKLHFDERRYSEAIVTASQALFWSERSASPDLTYRWQWQLARIYAAQGQVGSATQAYDAAIDALRRVQSSLIAAHGSADPVKFRKLVDPIFSEYATFLLSEAEHAATVDETRGLLEKTQTSFDKLKSIELANYFRDQCIAGLETRIEEVQRVITDQTAVIYTMLLQDRLISVITLGNQAKVLPPKLVARKELSDMVDRLRLQLESPSSQDADYLGPARDLYDLLIEPIATDLETQHIQTIIFVPDGPLSLIPLAALHDGQEFVVDRYAVATLPGLTLLDPREFHHADLRPLLGGLSEEVQSYPALDYVTRELEAIQEISNGAGTILLNDDFTLDHLNDTLAASPYSIVHLASHAQFSRKPEETFVVLAGGDKLTLDQLQKLMGPRRFRKQPIELISLSACQTAAGDERTALGLAGVALKAGARSALATLWSIEDRAAAELVNDFYRQLTHASLPKAEALRQAQIDLKREPRTRHPRYWAPFLVIGNWQ